MAVPPPTGPHSDLTGVNQDARVNTPTVDPKLGTAQSTDEADKGSKGYPNEGENAPAGDPKK